MRGAAERNLTDLDLDLPLRQWIVVTGVSGSGKSALVFDTLVREGQRRFLGALTPRARLFLGKLGRANVRDLTGLPPTLSIGAREIRASPRSTVGTRTGVLDLLRLWYAREAVDPEGSVLTRSSFTFNGVGACAACEGLGVEDEVDPALLVADGTKSIRAGALVPTLANGYTVYSQVTLEVMDQLCRAHGFDVDTCWQDLTDAQRQMIFFGTTVMKVPFGKHSIASRMKWKGITARPREEGYYRGLVPVISETLARSRNPNILRFVRTIPCIACAGTRLSRPGREAALGRWMLPNLLALPLVGLLRELHTLPTSPVARALIPSLQGRITRAVQLQLGHLSLDRAIGTLSGGEAQRLGIATQLGLELGGFLVAVDEPTLGLHPESQGGLADALEAVVASGNTLVTVEHDPDMVRHGDHHLQLGPGAGEHGGRVVHHGALSVDPLGPPPEQPLPVRPFEHSIRLHGATLHTLKQADLEVPLQRFTVVSGPSGAGKSSLVFQTLLPALKGQRGGDHSGLEGVPDDLSVRWVDASPIGRTPRSTPATWSGVFDRVRKLFATTPEAKRRGWTASRFSFNTAAGRCPRCEGLGFERIGLHMLRDLECPCEICAGSRYAPETLEVRYLGHSIADVLDLTAEKAAEVFTQNREIRTICEAMVDLGIGHLRWGQSSTTLSRGEAQRVKLATLLGKVGVPGIVLLDEPDRGLHPEDVLRLIEVLRRLVGKGHTVLAISHHRHLWSAADHRVGVRQGEVTIEPPLSRGRLSRTQPNTGSRPAAPAIVLRRVRTHNLKGIDARFPHGELTVVVGPSGSGKSALVFDTLAAEAWNRFSETLPFQVRRFARRMPRAQLDSAAGLGPTISLRQGRSRAGPRSTVATQSTLGPLLRLWWSRAGLLDGGVHKLSAQHFSADSALGACRGCEGMGSVLRCDPERLFSHPERSILDGAMAGSRPGKYFGEVGGQYMAMLRAAVAGDWTRPWSAMTKDQRQGALRGTGPEQVSVTWMFARGGREGEHRFEGPWEGLCVLVEREARQRARSKAAAEWAAPLASEPCGECDGARITAEASRVELAGRTLPSVLALSLADLLEWLQAAEGAVGAVLSAEMVPRVQALCELGLGHLSLDRRSASLSDGELQRLHLGGLSGLDLAGLTVVLDEPGTGLHASDLDALIARLHSLCATGHTVVVVSHRPAIIRAADHLVELGPGSGAEGGTLVAAGPVAVVLAGTSLTARAMAATLAAPSTRALPKPVAFRGCSLRTLAGFDVTLPGSGLVVITGVSGSGKSTLLNEVFAPSLEARSAIGCSQIEGLEHLGDVLALGSFAATSTPLEHLGLARIVQRAFASASDLPAKAFSFRSPAGRCESCRGTGRETVSMDFLADLSLPCSVCEGRRLRPQALEAEWKGVKLQGLLHDPVASLELEPGALRDGVEAMVRAGIGHLPLARSRSAMSEGEAQRVILTAALRGQASVLLLDEPARGLHEHDVARLVEQLKALCSKGHLVIAVSHRLSLIGAADHVLDLGPGSGKRGGRLVAEGPPGCLVQGATAAALDR